MPRHVSLKLHVRTIRRSTRIIASSLKELESRLRRAERLAANAPRSKRHVTITPKRRAQLKLQGQYMGVMRQLKRAQKAKVKAVRARRGIEAAIGVAKSLSTK